MCCFQSKCWQTSVQRMSLIAAPQWLKTLCGFSVQIMKTNPHALPYPPHRWPMQCPLVISILALLPYYCWHPWSGFQLCAGCGKANASFHPWPHTVPVFWLSTCWQCRLRMTSWPHYCLHPPCSHLSQLHSVLTNDASGGSPTPGFTSSLPCQKQTEPLTNKP